VVVDVVVVVAAGTVVVVGVPAGGFGLGAVRSGGLDKVGSSTGPIGLATMKLKMLLTRGAAASAPDPPWSMTARTRYWGFGLGPKATNQLFGSSLASFEAVPVFPARFHEVGNP
jgi:hypothetical protein